MEQRRSERQKHIPPSQSGGSDRLPIGDSSTGKALRKREAVRVLGDTINYPQVDEIPPRN